MIKHMLMKIKNANTTYRSQLRSTARRQVCRVLRFENHADFQHFDDYDVQKLNRNL